MAELTKMTVRVDQDVLKRVRLVAVQDDTTVQEIVGVLLAAYVQKRGGLSAGEQPGGEQRASSVEVLGARGEPEVLDPAGSRVPPAPAEKPFVPDWKKGKK